MFNGNVTTSTNDMPAGAAAKRSLLDRLFNRPKLREVDATDRLITYLMLFFAFVTIYTLLFAVAYKWEDFSGETAVKMATNFFRFDTIATAKILEMLASLVNTLALGFLTTFIGCLLGLVLGLFAARNLMSGLLPTLIRAIASLIRAVPTIIWVLIVVAGYGLTATTAVIGMLFHTLAFFIKSFAEAFEEIDEGTLDALKATGASWSQIVFGAVLPSSLTKIISWIAIRSEINFGVAVVIGPAAGVPGTIGTIINNAARAGQFAVQGFAVILVFLTAFIMETVINHIRQRSIIKS